MIFDMKVSIFRLTKAVNDQKHYYVFQLNELKAIKDKTFT